MESQSKYYETKSSSVIVFPDRLNKDGSFVNILNYFYNQEGFDVFSDLEELVEGLRFEKTFELKQNLERLKKLRDKDDLLLNEFSELLKEYSLKQIHIAIDFFYRTIVSKTKENVVDIDDSTLKVIHKIFDNNYIGFSKKLKVSDVNLYRYGSESLDAVLKGDKSFLKISHNRIMEVSVLTDKIEMITESYFNTFKIMKKLDSLFGEDLVNNDYRTTINYQMRKNGFFFRRSNGDGSYDQNYYCASCDSDFDIMESKTRLIFEDKAKEKTKRIVFFYCQSSHKIGDLSVKDIYNVDELLLKTKFLKAGI